MFNQLFREVPPKDLAEQVIKTFGLSGFNDERWFSKESMAQNQTAKQLTNMHSELYKVYLPCKAKSYLNDINEKSALTILRQLLRVPYAGKHYNLISRSKCHKGKRFLEYRLIHSI